MSDWSNADISRVKAMWRKGATAAEIAAALGNGLTRGAVLGKVHRLGLKRADEAPAKPRAASAASARKPAANASARKPAANRKAQAPLRAPAKLKPAPRKAEPEGPMPIWALGQCQCRWPIGNLLDPPGLFCAAATADGSSWCPVHEQMVYTGAARSRPDASPAAGARVAAMAGRGRF